MRLQLDRIRQAQREISSEFTHTLQFACPALSAATGCSVSLKAEMLNPVRSFKGRGVDTLLARMPHDGTRSVVCASAGNLGLALAYAGRRRGFDVTMVAARTAVPAKLQRMRDWGARVVLHGEDFDAAKGLAPLLARRESARLIVDSLDVDTCEGAGTIGLEIAESGQPVDAVLLALGNGALATGVGCAVKALMPGTQVVGVQAAAAPAMALSWRDKRPRQTDTAHTIADGIAVRVPIPAVLEDMEATVDDVLLVTESGIRQAMWLLLEHSGLAVEPSGAVPLAALLEHRRRFAARRVVVVLCGANISPDHFFALARKDADHVDPPDRRDERG